MVMDRREVARVLQVEPPASWDLAVLTQCLVPFEKECDPMLDVVQDVSIMTGGLLVRQGRVVPTPRQWPWRLGTDGRWVPMPPLPTPGPGTASR
ncbi:hypothetical protein D4740_09405 [Actinomyces sp. 2119]|uniref:Uncharacterized protein n=1 Tax=Actinomyces lilanjuaniae TaxID=2321394 RepID=A0ABN5PMY0_9ACTO|nr:MULTISPECIES: hypothetical protein [Actinomyces]AYD89013.1 hypothetical protein D5R93_01205 [Actinomyces lilanjuaniae]RJF41133.1 hypothetical protein D4740_09405 [Actinomyces sp. 2119]